jgi:hypothetical protein
MKYSMIVLLLMMGTAHAQIDCQESYPGEKRPEGWAYRTIDGRKCWYEGPLMLSKKKLRWSTEVIVPMIILNTPPRPDDETFRARWNLYGKED